MALKENEQIISAIENSRHVLITFKKDYSADALSSALGLSLFLEKEGKLVDIACDDFKASANFDFLGNIGKVLDKINHLQKFVISLDTSVNKIEEFSYNYEGEHLKIYITPKNGAFSREDVSTSQTDYRYDLIITLDTPDLDSLGKIYQSSTDFFFNTTIINIDNNPENEHYGQINLINLNATASAEIVYDLLKNWKPDLIDSKIATAFLAGLIAKTKSFKTPNVTPKTLEIAGELLAAEADRDLIVKKLYRSRSLSTLNLWGRALARLKSHDNNRLIWSLITDNDFIESQSNPGELPEVIEELISFIPGVEAVVLFYQQGQNVCVIIKTLKNHNALYLVGNFEAKGNTNTAEFCLENKNLVDAEKEVVENIKEKLK